MPRIMAKATARAVFKAMSLLSKLRAKDKHNFCNMDEKIWRISKKGRRWR
jgi:hypothetical protein